MIRAAALELPRGVPLGDALRIVYILRDDEARLKGVPGTADGVVGWLRANPNLSVTTPSRGTIGSDLPATVVDVSVAGKADNDDPGCPAKPCANFLGFPQWDETYGIAGEASRVSTSPM